MSKNKKSAFVRGLTYHAGAGIGEAIRTVTTVGASIGVAYLASQVKTLVERRELKDDIMTYFDKKK